MVDGPQRFQRNHRTVVAEMTTRSRSSALEPENHRRLRHHLVEYYWAELNKYPLSKAVRCAFNLCRYMATIVMFLSRCGPNGPLRKFIMARPEILKMVCRPYLAANWDVPTRFTRVVDHCETVKEIGGALDVMPDAIITLSNLAPLGERYRLTLDQARWLFYEGQLVLSLWDGIDRIFSIQFCLSSREDKRVVYVGALQGRAQNDSEPDILARYRIFTKSAAGMRPREFVIEMLKAICRIVSVTEIRAVSNLNQPARQSLSDIKLSYDEIWQERGGVDGGNGFFIIPTTRGRRSNKEISAKKRTMYARRYEMLDALEAELGTAMSQRSPLDRAR